jgi:hypothetical protein
MNNYITNSDYTISDVSAVRKSIYNAYKKSLPSNPKNENFLLINDKLLSNIIIIY